MFNVACYVGFASCKTFGKQPKRPCFGRSPKQVAGTAVPVFSPFPGKGGRGIGIENLLYFIKNRFFLQAEPLCALQSGFTVIVKKICRKIKKIVGKGLTHTELCAKILSVVTAQQN